MLCLVNTFSSNRCRNSKSVNLNTNCHCYNVFKIFELKWWRHHFTIELCQNYYFLFATKKYFIWKIIFHHRKWDIAKLGIWFNCQFFGRVIQFCVKQILFSLHTYKYSFHSTSYCSIHLQSSADSSHKKKATINIVFFICIEFEKIRTKSSCLCCNHW